MEEPTAILTYFHQFSEDLNRNILEEHPSWDDGKRKNTFPVLWPFEAEESDELNLLLNLDTAENALDEDENCNGENLTNALNETKNMHELDHIDAAEFHNNELDVILVRSQSNNFEVASDAAGDDLQNSVDFSQSEKMQGFEVKEEFLPTFEEEEIQRVSQDLSLKPQKSPVCVQPSFMSNEPPPGSTLTRATFSPSASPADKQPQLPALFSGLKVLRKGLVGPDLNTVSEFKPISQGSKTQGTFLDQISQFLNQEKQKEEEFKLNELDNVKEAKTSADAVFDAFKAFFTPKPLRKDPSEKVDLEAVRRRIRNERNQLKSLFEKGDKTTEEEPSGKSESAIDAEDRTPGRLQAVWPPLQEEEKVGLKYTEAEHQAALLQLKRECNEDLEKLQEDYAEELSRLKEESDDSVARLEFTVIELQSRLSQSESRRHGDVRDASVSTGDDAPLVTFRSVCSQTDREMFVKLRDDEDEMMRAQKVEPQKADEDLFGRSLSGQNDGRSSPHHKSLSDQSHSVSDALSPCSHRLNSNSPGIPPPPPGPPPPPPLPPSGQGNGVPPLPQGWRVTVVDKAPRKPAVEPSQPMKPLYWTRIQIQEDNTETVWSTLKEANINTGDFEDLFAKTTTQMKRKPLSEAYGKKTKTRKIVKLLDGKRSQAVGILISSLHLDMKDIEHAVLTVDNSVVDLDTIEALYENKAQPSELERIKNLFETSNEEEIKLLDKPEQFLYELSQIPDFAGRAQCIIFQSVFVEGTASTQRKLHAVSSVCEVLLRRPSVKEIIGVVLALGNHMNGGSRTRGQADGFGLEILPKLKDVKSRDNRISLVDYVVSYYLRNGDKNAGTDRSVFPLPEPQDVFLAAQVKFEDLHNDLRHLKRELTACEGNIHSVCSNSSPEHVQPFKHKMEAFVLSAREKLSEATHHLLTVENSFQELLVHFALQSRGDKEVTPSHFFMLWFEFCADFKVRWKKESRSVSREKLKEAQMSVKRITGEKRVETKKINSNSLKERLRQKELHLSSV